MTSPAPPHTSATSGGSRPAYRRVPGPVDRITFFEAQRRNRRAAWRFSIMAALAVMLTGLPVSVIVTPFLYAAALLGGAIASVVFRIPPSTLTSLRGLPLIIPTALGVLAQSQGTATHMPPQVVAALAVALVIPGALVLLALWIMLRVVFRRAGVGGVLLTLGARDPTLNDFEEQQLMNVVEEMAIAAGVPPPRVMLIDSAAADGAANAAAVGWSINDATVVVTRPLLDDLSRDETQGVIARIIASIGNGDLKIALIILSVFQTVGLVGLVLNTAFGWQSRRTLFRFARLVLVPAWGQKAKARRAAEKQVVMGLLARGADMGGTDMDAWSAKSNRQGCMSLLTLPMIPVLWSTFTVNFVVSMSTAMVTGPLIGAMWKRRELLADATAVQLTRNPDGLAGALEEMTHVGVAVPNGESVSHLFAAWWGRAGADNPDSSNLTMVSRYMHAKVQRRLAQLQAIGAHIDPATGPDITPATAYRPKRAHGMSIVALAIIVPLGALLVLLLSTAFVLMMGLDLVFMTIALMIVAGVAGLILHYGPGVWQTYGPHHGGPPPMRM